MYVLLGVSVLCYKQLGIMVLQHLGPEQILADDKNIGPAARIKTASQPARRPPRPGRSST